MVLTNSQFLSILREIDCPLKIRSQYFVVYCGSYSILLKITIFFCMQRLQKRVYFCRFQDFAEIIRKFRFLQIRPFLLVQEHIITKCMIYSFYICNIFVISLNNICFSFKHKVIMSVVVFKHRKLPFTKIGTQNDYYYIQKGIFKILLHTFFAILY